MKVFTVIPVGPEANGAHLAVALESVARQEVPAGMLVRALVVWDGAPAPGAFHVVRLRPEVQAIGLPAPARDIGSTPRTIGAAFAWGQGAGMVTFLDADCWYEPEHIALLARLQRECRTPVVCSGRVITDWTGRERAPCREMVRGSGFYDTNTYGFSTAGRAVSYAFGMLRPEDHIVGDRHVSAAAEALGLACHYLPTVVYRSTWRFHYEENGWKPPAGVRLK